MTTYLTEYLSLFDYLDVPLKATFYRPLKKKYKATLLYFHGGGLIFGERDDLPKEYLELFTKEGYGILTLDYPLAPETKIPDTLKTSENLVEWFIKNAEGKIKVPHNLYYLFGRSAGAYLALSTSLTVSKKPNGIITLYGYFNLNDASFHVPNHYYLKFPKVNSAQLTQKSGSRPIVKGDMAKRYPFYIAARQNGNWMELLLDSSQDAADYSLSKEQLATLPPTFISAASGDQDVPVYQSKQLAQFIPDNQIKLVESKEHDFDRTEINTNGQQVYESIIEWLNSTLNE